MAKLSRAARKQLPASSYAIPSKKPEAGSYPIPDKAHGRNALARVSQHGTPTEKAAVRRKVKAKFPSIKQRTVTSPEGIQGARMKKFSRKGKGRK